MEIKVEKGIPLPTKPHFAATYYPFDKMKVGDSFAVPKEHASTVRQRMAAINQTTGERDPRVFTSRMMGEKLRVWRTE